MKVIGIVPAKGTSDRVKDKNLQTLEYGGETLVELAVKRLLECNSIDEVYLDTEDDRILEACKNLPMKVLLRPEELATNEISFNSLIEWEINQLDLQLEDMVVHTFSTAPLLKSSTTESSVNRLIGDSEFDSLASVINIYKPFWYRGIASYDKRRLTPTTEMEPLTIETGGLYAFYVQTFANSGSRIGKSLLHCEVGSIESIDIDEPEDLKWARRLWKIQNQ